MDSIDNLVIRFDYNDPSSCKIKWNKTILSLCYALKQLKYVCDKFGVLLFDHFVANDKIIS